MMNKEGKFVISLDFELYWGIRDKISLDQYGENILGVFEIVPKLLKIFDKYEIQATFATVGALFAEDPNMLIEYLPNKKPEYSDKNLSPYNEHIDSIRKNEKLYKYHFAHELIKFIKSKKRHEISTHTFSHYFCLEDGSSKESFKEDLLAAIKIASKDNISLKTIIFPKNQVNQDFLKICLDLGIDAYRGNENTWFYKTRREYNSILNKRVFRFIDSYINISGHHCYDIYELENNIPINIPSSRFLRPYNSRLKFFEFLRKDRIKKSMTYAAKNGLIYHLWWHPHNFGINQKENLNFLNDILEHYQYLNIKYGFKSSTMENIVLEVKDV